jgi:hypothetical protein
MLERKYSKQLDTKQSTKTLNLKYKSVWRYPHSCSTSDIRHWYHICTTWGGSLLRWLIHNGHINSSIGNQFSTQNS